jgi:hypothetical protein
MTLKPKLYIMTYRPYPYAWIYSCTHQYFLIFFETKKSKLLLNLILDWDLVILTRFFLLWIQNMEIYLWCILIKKLYYLFIEAIFEGSCFELKKVNFWSETYLHLLNYRIFIEEFWKSTLQKSFKTNIRIYTNFDEWKQQVLLSMLNMAIRHV